MIDFHTTGYNEYSFILWGPKLLTCKQVGNNSNLYNLAVEIMWGKSL